MSLGNGIWLLGSLVPWYFSAVGYSILTARGEGGPWWLPLFGVVAIVSMILSAWFVLRHRERRWGWFFLPLAVCFAFVFVSGLFRGKLPDPTMARWVGTAVEGAALLAFAWFARPGWLAGASLATFCITVWLVALFVSSMSFTNTWL